MEAAGTGAPAYGLTAGCGGLAGGSFFLAGRSGSEPADEVGAWCDGGVGVAETDTDAMEELRSFMSSSFSVFRAKQKSLTLFWKVTSNWVRSL